MNKQLVYLASPYSYPDEKVRVQRFETICKIAAKMMNEGMLIYCPIAHTHPIAVHGSLPLGWDYWHKYDYAILSCCKMMIVCKIEGWEESKGIQGEIAICKELGIEVGWIKPEEYL